MLQVLHKLFASKTAEPEAVGGKVTLGDVLRRELVRAVVPAQDRFAREASGRRRRRSCAPAAPDGSLLSPGLVPARRRRGRHAERLTERVILTALRDFEDCGVRTAAF